MKSACLQNKEHPDEAGYFLREETEQYVVGYEILPGKHLKLH